MKGPLYSWRETRRKREEERERERERERRMPEATVSTLRSSKLLQFVDIKLVHMKGSCNMRPRLYQLKISTTQLTFTNTNTHAQQLTYTNSHMHTLYAHTHTYIKCPIGSCINFIMILHYLVYDDCLKLD